MHTGGVLFVSLSGASPPAQHQREEPDLAQPQQQRELSRTEDIQSPQ